MSLKCPICGKEYYYESKICSECEEYSMRSLRIPETKVLGIKWNCGIFLEEYNGTFGRRKLDEYGWKKPVELFCWNTKQRKMYDWNCSKSNSSIECFEIDDVSKDALDKSNKIPSLIYE